MFNILNEEDSRIRKLIDKFDFQVFGVPIGNIDLNLRDKLFNDIIKEIGHCKNCNAFVNKTYYCNTLKIHTEPEARCSDFEPFDESEKPAFEIMSEEFQNMKTFETKSRKPSLEE